MSSPLKPLALLTLALLWKIVACQITNVTHTIDDADPAIVYTIEAGVNSTQAWWFALNQNTVAQCSDEGTACPSDMQLTSTWNESVHVASDRAVATYSFMGQEIAIYFVLHDRLGYQTNITFSIDGQKQGELIRTGAGTAEYLYDQQVFNASNLTNTTHTLVIQGGTPNGMMLDYLTYTQLIDATTLASSSSSPSTSTSTSPSPSPTANLEAQGKKNIVGPIVGGVIAGMVVLLVLSFITSWLRKTRRRDKRCLSQLRLPFDEPNVIAQPFMFPPTDLGHSSRNTPELFTKTLASPENSFNTPMALRAALLNASTDHDIDPSTDQPPAYSERSFDFRAPAKTPLSLIR